MATTLSSMRTALAGQTLTHILQEIHPAWQISLTLLPESLVLQGTQTLAPRGRSWMIFFGQVRTQVPQPTQATGSTTGNSSTISYAVFCLKKKEIIQYERQ